MYLLYTHHLYPCASCSICQSLAPYTSHVPLCQLFYMPKTCSIHITCTSVPAVLYAQVLLHTHHLYLCASCSICLRLTPYTSPILLCQMFYMPLCLLYTHHLYLCASCSICLGLVSNKCSFVYPGLYPVTVLDKREPTLYVRRTHIIIIITTRQVSEGLPTDNTVTIWAQLKVEPRKK